MMIGSWDPASVPTGVDSDDGDDASEAGGDDAGADDAGVGVVTAEPSVMSLPPLLLSLPHDAITSAAAVMARHRLRFG